MKKDNFYSLCRNLGKKENVKTLRKGYIVETNNNVFGICKLETTSQNFSIIDLTTGLDVNFLHYHRLKDFKNNIEKFDKKLQEFKSNHEHEYKQFITMFEQAKIESEV